MASDPDFVQYVCDQARGAGDVSARKLFGEYALYLDARVIALICDDQVYVRDIEVTQALLPNARLAPPYPGAKPYRVVGDRIEDHALVAELFAQLARVLPPPRHKATPRARKRP